MDENSKILNRLDKIEQMLQDQSLQKKEILTLNEAASYLGVSKSHLYKMTSARTIPHYCPTGKIIRFKRSDLDHFLQLNKRDSREQIENEAIKHSIKN
ncbi:MAG: helix-turn-helix domain-containing protein [Bacteroidales bacterium]|nr:helix-turn-helix domain-containing protein [Bacteroidales bacterium]